MASFVGDVAVGIDRIRDTNADPGTRFRAAGLGRGSDASD